MRSNKRGDGKASHIVSAWSKESGFCLGQKAVEEKSNEIVAIPELLDKIQIKGQIVTIDAMGTQTAIAEKIKKKRADYVLALKRNQNSLYEDVQEYFSDEEFQKEIRERGNYKKPRKSTWSDRDKGVLSDRGYKVVKPEKELERTVQYSNGEENAEERRKYKNREPLFHQQFKRRH